MEEGNLAEPPGRRSLSGLVCVCVWIWFVGRIIGGAGPYSCCRVAASQTGEPSLGCLRPGPRLTTPRCCTALHSLTWEDEKEHQMLFVLLMLCVSVALCACCLSCTVSLAQFSLQLSTCPLSRSPLTIPQCFHYVRNVAPPMLFSIYLKHHLVWLL